MYRIRSDPSVPKNVLHKAERGLMVEKTGGPERDRTAGLLVANEALSQLSYRPNFGWMRDAVATYRDTNLTRSIIQRIRAG